MICELCMSKRNSKFALIPPICKYFSVGSFLPKGYVYSDYYPCFQGVLAIPGMAR
jgi:hypothetical protein